MHGVFYTYILANQRHGTVYVGITNDIARRVWEHKSKLIAGFTRQYHVDRLVYFEVFRDALSAIAREKQLKAGSRARKLALIEASNPGWSDLSEGWYGQDTGLAAMTGENSSAGLAMTGHTVVIARSVSDEAIQAA